MKSFKAYMTEAETKPPTTTDKARDRQSREKGDMKTRHGREMERAREQDFRQKESERRQQEAQKKAQQAAQKSESVEDDAEFVPEYLEDGTLVLVKNHKSMTPGQ